MIIDDSIVKVLEETKEKIQYNLEAKNINATGRTSLSFRVLRREKKILLVAGGDSQAWGGRTAPVESLEVGRGPGGDYKQLRPIIVRWSIAKGIKLSGANASEEESHRWAFATIVAKNIVARGTRRHSKHEDVYSSELEEAKNKLRSVISTEIKNMMSSIIAQREITINKNEL